MKLKNNLLYVVGCLINCICIGILIFIGALSSNGAINFEDASGTITTAEVLEEDSKAILKFWDGKAPVVYEISKTDLPVKNTVVDIKYLYYGDKLEVAVKPMQPLVLQVVVLILVITCVISAIILCFKIDFN